MTICVLCFRLIFPPISLDPLVFFLRDMRTAVLQSNRRLLVCWDSVKASIEADDLLQNTVNTRVNWAAPESWISPSH